MTTNPKTVDETVKIKRKIIHFTKKCKLCKEPPVIGFIDFGKGGAHMAVCNTHLVKFCVSVLKKNEELERKS